MEEEMAKSLSLGCRVRVFGCHTVQGLTALLSVSVAAFAADVIEDEMLSREGKEKLSPAEIACPWPSSYRRRRSSSLGSQLLHHVQNWQEALLPLKDLSGEEK